MSRLNPQEQKFGRLTGRQRKQFTDALTDAFTLTTFDLMLVQEMGLRNREEWALGDDLVVIIDRVVSKAEQLSRTSELLTAALAARPAHVGLFQFAQQFEVAPASAAAERLVRDTLGFIDPATWVPLLMARVGQVCRVEVRATQIRGTGFLVGPDLVLTNHHVVAEVIAGQIPATYLQVRFDRGQPSGATTMGGVYAVHPDEWLVAAAAGVDDLFVTAAADRLDFALLRLADPAGAEVVDAVEGTRRGWIPMPLDDPAVKTGDPLLLLGHPNGGPLKLSLDTGAVIAVNPAGSRLRYRTNTEPGSSGSPCFDLGWTLLAVHHAGDPAATPEYNQGIPIAALRAHLQQQLFGGALVPWQAAALTRLLQPD